MLIGAVKKFAAVGAFNDNIINEVDTKSAAWLAMLPLEKKDPMRADGTVDEIMFLAHMCNAV